MILLKETKEYRVESENEAKDLMEKFRTEAHEKGYQITKCGYTHKDKKSKGEIIDSCEIVSCTMVYSTIWEGLE